MKRRACLAIVVALGFSACKKTTSPEAAAYASKIVFSNVRLSAAENAAQQTIHYLRVAVTNRGDRPVKHLEVILYFQDAQGKVVLTERAMAISPRLRPLAPGEQRDFRQGFDPPADWNRASPNVGIAYLEID
jgi:hypothetical protein